MQYVSAPLGGITAELGGKTRPLLLRNAEIERFEDMHNPLGVFEVLDRMVGKGPAVQLRHCRDLVAFGMIGAGMGEGQASAVMAAMPVSDGVMLRSVAQSLLIAAFLPPKDEQTPGKDDPAGSESDPATPDGTSETASDPVSGQG